MELSVEFDVKLLEAAQREIADIRGNIKQVLANAVNDTAKQVKVQISSAIRAKVNIKKQDIDEFITVSRASRAHTACGVRLSESQRLPLKYFGARQTKEGVSYQIDKSGPRKILKHAFGPKIPKFHGHVMLRQGKARLPLRKPPPRGPSPWGVFVMARLEAETLRLASEKLNNNLARRVNFEVLKAHGAI